VRYLGTPGTIESFDVVGVASTNDDSSRRWTAEVRGRWPPEVRASDGKGEGAAKVSKALRRTEPPEVLRGQLVNYDDTDSEMRASLEFYTALRGRVSRLTRLSP
jgi:hypothetical protein